MVRQFLPPSHARKSGMCKKVEKTQIKAKFFSSFHFLSSCIVVEEQIPYFLIQFPRKLFFFEFGNPKVTLHKAKGHSTQRCGNYSREETIQGRKLYEEIRYVIQNSVPSVVRWRQCDIRITSEEIPSQMVGDQKGAKFCHRSL